MAGSPRVRARRPFVFGRRAQLGDRDASPPRLLGRRVVGSVVLLPRGRARRPILVDGRAGSARRIRLLRRLSRRHVSKPFFHLRLYGIRRTSYDVVQSTDPDINDQIVEKHFALNDKQNVYNRTICSQRQNTESFSLANKILIVG